MTELWNLEHFILPQQCFTFHLIIWVTSYLKPHSCVKMFSQTGGSTKHKGRVPFSLRNGYKKQPDFVHWLTRRDNSRNHVHRSEETIFSTMKWKNPVRDSSMPFGDDLLNHSEWNKWKETSTWMTLSSWNGKWNFTLLIDSKFTWLDVKKGFFSSQCVTKSIIIIVFSILFTQQFSTQQERWNKSNCVVIHSLY